MGALSSGNLINGITRVLEKWKDIFHNSNEFISGILVEEPLDLIEPLVERAKNGIKINSIFSESTIVPSSRAKLLQRKDLQNLLKNGSIERKMRKDVGVVVVLNEKEACVMFPTLGGEPDISKMFYGKDPLFHEWCFDYFGYLWKNSTNFQERKLKENSISN